MPQQLRKKAKKKVARKKAVRRSSHDDQVRQVLIHIADRMDVLESELVNQRIQAPKTAQTVEELVKVFGPLLQKLNAKIDSSLEDDEIRREERKLDMAQKSRFGVPNREKMYLALELEMIELERRVARGGTEATVADKEELKALKKVLARSEEVKDDSKARVRVHTA